MYVYVYVILYIYIYIYIYICIYRAMGNLKWFLRSMYISQDAIVLLIVNFLGISLVRINLAACFFALFISMFVFVCLHVFLFFSDCL